MRHKRKLYLALALVMVFTLSGCRRKPAANQEADTYTYNYALSEFPTNWNPATYKTSTDSQIRAYITDGFYTLDYNETKTGYALVPAMAAGEPRDVTAQYVGRYGIAQGDTAKAYVIPLRSDLCWEDGTPITATDFVESAKRFLDPKAQNYRADTLYSGSVVIYNAENYLKQGQEGRPAMDWEGNVGWFALSERELCVVLENSLSGFYLKYNLPAPLVHIPTYDACASYKDGIYTNSYGTTAETTRSYGPYKLTAFQADKQYTLTRNDQYYGLTANTYQTTAIVVDYVKEAATRLQLFRQGKLDSYDLTVDDLTTYQRSDFAYLYTGDSTFGMVFNPNFDALKAAQAKNPGTNKTILTLEEFRMAMSFSLDRSAFCLAAAPLNTPGLGLFSAQIIADPDTGESYRSTEAGKQALAALGTGYDLTRAKELFNAAYDKAIAQGLMTQTDKVELRIGTPNSTSAFYNNGYEFLVNNYTQAVTGTKLEGKLTFTRDDTLGNAYSTALKQNRVDMLFGVGWTGSALDPYELIDAYLSPNYQYDPALNYSNMLLTISLDGEKYTASVTAWQAIMNGQSRTVIATDGREVTLSRGPADGNTAHRLTILAALEGAILKNYNFIPIMDDGEGHLRGRQIQYPTEQYVFGLDFGGIKYYTYAYTDAQWEDFVSKSGGSLDYT